MSSRSPEKAVYPPSFPPEGASAWRRIRKYAVPRWMIEQATSRRLVGDWRGACAAANVDVAFSPADVANEHGAEIAAALDDDLRNLAPDLMRWHMPRHLQQCTTLRPDQCVLLAGYGDRPTDGPYLYVTTPTTVDRPQRLILGFGPLDSHTDNWLPARHLWDVRRAGDLRERCGGGPNRMPFHGADGTLLSADELPSAGPVPDDPAGHAEWVITWQDRGHLKRAFDTADVLLDETPPEFDEYEDYDPPPLSEILMKYPLALTVLEPWVRELASAGFGDRFHIPRDNLYAVVIELHPHIGFDEGLFPRAPIRSGVRIRLASYREVDASDETDGISPLSDACWRRLPDLDLLRFGHITPAQLHPLVSASLFPDREVKPTDGPPGPGPLSPARLDCRGEWHEVLFRDGRLQMPHPEEEIQRERALYAFGGAITGCFAVQEAWRSGTRRLPDALADQRDELFSRVQHGDTPGVLRMLGAGIDPHVRGGKQRTLLHLLHLLDHEVVLPALLESGLDLEARDQLRRTPLHIAVTKGTVALVKALLEAGARTDIVDARKNSLPRLIADNRRYELHFLKVAIELEHPELIADYPTRKVGAK